MTASMEALALGVALIVPALGVLWKCSSLRGDLFNKWNERVDIAEAGLSEHAIGLLRELQDRTDLLLGQENSSEFDPALALADPAPLTRITRKFHRAIVARKRLARRFALLVLLGAVAPFLVIPYLLGSVLAFAYYSELYSGHWAASWGIVLAVSSLGLGAFLVLGHLYLNWRLASAEIMSRQSTKKGALSQ